MRPQHVGNPYALEANTPSSLPLLRFGLLQKGGLKKLTALIMFQGPSSRQSVTLTALSWAFLPSGLPVCAVSLPLDDYYSGKLTTNLLSGSY